MFKKQPWFILGQRMALDSDTCGEIKRPVIFMLEVPTYCVYFSPSLVSFSELLYLGKAGDFRTWLFAQRVLNISVPVFSGPKATEMQDFVKCVH